MDVVVDKGEVKACVHLKEYPRAGAFDPELDAKIGEDVCEAAGRLGYECPCSQIKEYLGVVLEQAEAAVSGAVKVDCPGFPLVLEVILTAEGGEAYPKLCISPSHE